MFFGGQNPCGSHEHTILSGVLTTHLFPPKINHVPRIVVIFGFRPRVHPSVDSLFSLPLRQSLFGLFAQLDPFNTIFTGVRNHQLMSLMVFRGDKSPSFIGGSSQNMLTGGKTSHHLSLIKGLHRNRQQIFGVFFGVSLSQLRHNHF